MKYNGVVNANKEYTVEDFIQNNVTSYGHLVSYLESNKNIGDDWIRCQLLALSKKGCGFNLNRAYQIWQVVKFFEGITDSAEPSASILDMATGTGKTNTFLLVAFLAIHSPNKAKYGYDKITIVVPTILLKNQLIERWNQDFFEYKTQLSLYEGIEVYDANQCSWADEVKIVAMCHKTFGMIAKNEFSKQDKYVNWVGDCSKQLVICDEAQLTFRSQQILEDNSSDYLLASGTASEKCGEIDSLQSEARKCFKQVISLPQLQIDLAVKAGILAPVISTEIYLPIDPSNSDQIEKANDAELTGLVGNILSKNEYLSLILKLYGTFVNEKGFSIFGQQGIILAPTIDLANKITKEINRYWQQNWKGKLVFLAKQRGSDNLAASYHSKEAPAVNQNTIEAFKQSALSIIVGVSAAAVGLDLPSAHWVINLTPSSTKGHLIQAYGRVVRLSEKKFAGNFIQLLFDKREQQPRMPSYDVSPYGIIGRNEVDEISSVQSLQFVKLSSSEERSTLSEKFLRVYATKKTGDSVSRLHALTQLRLLFEKIKNKLYDEIKEDIPLKQVNRKRKKSGKKTTSKQSAMASDSQSASADNTFKEDEDNILKQIDKLLEEIRKKVKIPFDLQKETKSSRKRGSSVGHASNHKSGLMGVIVNRLSSLHVGSKVKSSDTDMLQSLVETASDYYEKVNDSRYILDISQAIKSVSLIEFNDLITAIESHTDDLVKKAIHKSDLGYQYSKEIINNNSGTLINALVRSVITAHQAKELEDIQEGKRRIQLWANIVKQFLPIQIKSDLKSGKKKPSELIYQLLVTLNLDSSLLEEYVSYMMEDTQNANLLKHLNQRIDDAISNGIVGHVKILFDKQINKWAVIHSVKEKFKLMYQVLHSKGVEVRHLFNNEMDFKSCLETLQNRKEYLEFLSEHLVPNDEDSKLIMSIPDEGIKNELVSELSKSNEDWRKHFTSFVEGAASESIQQVNSSSNTVYMTPEDTVSDSDSEHDEKTASDSQSPDKSIEGENVDFDKQECHSGIIRKRKHVAEVSRSSKSAKDKHVGGAAKEDSLLGSGAKRKVPLSSVVDSPPKRQYFENSSNATANEGNTKSNNSLGSENSQPDTVEIGEFSFFSSK